MSTNKKAVSTAEQKSDETMFRELKKLLRSAKRKAEAAQVAENEVFEMLFKMGISPADSPTSAENANNLQEPITCHLSYGEYTIDGIINEVRSAYFNTSHE